MEFQAVVMAAGHGSRMTDLVSNTPKALLPIANRPMVWYPINMLERAGFTEAIMVVLESQKSEIQKTLQEICDTKLQLDFVTIKDNEDIGTADSLRLIANMITKDILMVSCDLITDLPLHLLADVHRTNDATITMLLAPGPELAESVPGPKANKKIERDFAGLDEKGDRVLFISLEADLDDDKIEFRKSFFKRHPYINIKTKLVDSHLYLMKKQVLDLLQQQKSLSAFKGEVVPYMVRKQSSYQPTKGENTQEISTDSPKSNLNNSKTDAVVGSDHSHEDLMKHVFEMSTFSNHAEKDVLKCCCYVMEKGFCLRANSILTYCEANRQVPKQLSSLVPGETLPLVHLTAVISQQTQTGTDSMLGEGTTVGARCGVKRSVIGAHCVIKDKVKVANSVIMDHVTIEEGTVLTGCVVCSNALLGEKCDLKDCLVGASQNIISLSKYSNEVIGERDKMMAID